MVEGMEKRRIADWWIVVSGGFAFLSALSWGAADARIGDHDFSWPMSPILWLSLLLVAAAALSLVRAARRRGGSTRTPVSRRPRTSSSSSPTRSTRATGSSSTRS